MQRAMKNAGLQPIQFEFGNFFTAIFKRPMHMKNGAVSGGVNGGVNLEFNDRREKILLFLKKEYKKNINQLVVALEIPKRTLERDISKMKKEDLLNFVVSPKTGGDVLTEKGKKLLVEISSS